MTSETFCLSQGFSAQQSNPNAKICAMCPNKLAQTRQEQMSKVPKKISDFLVEMIPNSMANNFNINKN